MCTEKSKRSSRKQFNKIIEYKTNILFPLAKAIQLENFKKILFTVVMKKCSHVCV